MNRKYLIWGTVAVVLATAGAFLFFRATSGSRGGGSVLSGAPGEQPKVGSSKPGAKPEPTVGAKKPGAK